MFDFFLVVVGALLVLFGLGYAIDVMFMKGDPSDDLEQVFHGSLAAVFGVLLLGYGAIHEKLEAKVKRTDFGNIF